MATIDIGKLTFTHKGDYAGGTAYVANDVVYYNGSAYIAKTSTTGNLPTSTAHWNTFAAGSGGIWNSGLSIGSAGQVVKVNSGASALEFGTLSSDFVKLHTVNHSGSNVTSYGFDGYFDDSIYSSYKYIGYHRTATGQSSSTAHSMMRYNINGTENSGGDYNWAWQSGYWNGNAGDQNRGNSNDSKVRMFNTWDESQRQDTTLNFQLDIQNPQSQTIHCTTIWSSGMSFTGNEIAAGVGAMNFESSNESSSTLVTGFTFRYDNGNNFNLAYGTLYGLKK